MEERIDRWIGIATVFLLLELCAPCAFGEAPRAPGSNTGDGSGPFTGLAQAPEANLFVGAASTSIPIELPPGRKGMTPRLALTYNSSAGPSPYGYGWDLPLGRIQRSTKHGVLPCSDSPLLDDFVVLLPDATVECTLDRATGVCVPAVEESFLRIQFVASDNHWEVWDRSGTRYAFGENQASRTPVYPECHTFAWALTAIEDRNSNRANVWYVNESHVIYPQTIQYGGSSSTSHRFEVTFTWEPRPADDQIVNSLNGVPAKLSKRLTRIEVRYPIGGRRVRWYGLTYADDRQARQTFLNAVTLFDDNDQALSRADGLPASTTFLYHEGDPSAARFGFANQPQSVARPQLRTPPNGDGAHSEILRWNDNDDGQRRDILDMNGDGFPDLVDAWPIHELRDGCTESTAAAAWDVYFGSPGGFTSKRTAWAVPYRGLMCDLRRSWGTRTERLTVDLTGDGLPDFIDSRTTPWQVYPGTPHSPYSPNNGWGFDRPRAWAAPLPLVQESQSGVEIGNPGSNNDWHGSAVVQDLIDMNGDGRLDLVRTPGAGGSGLWRVWLNNGSGFDAEQAYVGFSNVLAFNSDDNGQIVGTFDVNGDSLPDWVMSQQASGGPYTGSWTVVLNTGHAINRSELWELPAVGHWRHIRKNDGDPVDTVRDFFDVNGDGLPDIVDSSGWSPVHPKWQVFLNRGAGFRQDAVEWDAPNSRIRCSSSGGGGITADTFDLDGDGMVDHVEYLGEPYAVHHNADGAWMAACESFSCLLGRLPIFAVNPNGSRPDLLERMENGIGGTTTLAYRPSSQWNNTDENGVPRLPLVLWTLSRIERDDGLCDNGACLTRGSHSVRSDLEYAYGRYDAVARELRGFRSVRQSDAGGAVQTTTFHQDAARKGKVDAISGAFAADRNSWECVDPSTQAPQSCPDTLDPGERLWVRLRQADHYDYGAGGSSKHRWTQNLSWDSAGNIIHSLRSGDGVAAPVETFTRFGTLEAVSDKPERVRVEAGGVVFEEKWFGYDARGNLTNTAAWLDQVPKPGLPSGGSCPEAAHAGGGTCNSTAMVYDSYGNLVTAIDSNGGTASTSFDSATHIYPWRVSNAAGHVVQTTYDPACGTLLRQTAAYPAGQSADAEPFTEYTYDSFCRLRTVAASHPGAAAPIVSRVLTHLPGAAASPTEIMEQALIGGDAAQPATWRWTERRQFFDALGRALQTQRSAVVDGTATLVTDAAVEYDARGNPAARFGPFAATAGLQTSPPEEAGRTSYTYDAVSRVISITNPNGSVRSMAYPLPWQSISADECFAAKTCQGEKTIDTRDAFGQTVERRIYRGSHLASRTSYRYDGLGRLLATKQGTATSPTAEKTAVLNAYDSLGRKIRVVDPDGGSSGPGTWTYGYDLVGNLIYQDDPKSAADTPPSPQHVQFVYDQLNRVRRKVIVAADSFCRLADAACSAQVVDAVDFTYDQPHGDLGCAVASCPTGHCEIGQVTSVDEQDGNHTRFCYDLRGRPSHIGSVVAVEGRTLSTTTQYTYDVADHLRTLRYPDGEVVTHSYDAAGQLLSLDGSNANGQPVAYLVDLTYDRLGRPQRIVHGNDSIDALSYWGAEKSFRLQQIISAGLVPVQNLRYDQYQANGMLTQVIDVLHPAPAADPLSNSATFGYDGIGQLSLVRDSAMVNNVYRHDDRLRNLRRKHLTRLSYRRAHPHQPVRVGKYRIAYDTNGNQIVGSDGLRQYRYTAEDHLEQIDLGDGRSVRFAYDYTGRRVATTRSDAFGEQVTRYIADLAELTPQYLTKHYFAGNMHIASQRVATPPEMLAQITPAVQVANAGATWHIALRSDVRNGLALAVVVGMMLLYAVPGRRKPVVGVVVRRGAVLSLIVVYTTASLVGPLAVRRAAAQPIADETLGILHYHHDHLGSTQVITRADGSVFRYLRYSPYGDVRGSWNASFQPASGCAVHGYCRQFTGYDTEPQSGLQYAGARFYDPAMGMYLTHDPSRQFPNPYSYVGWNPVNATDPDGQFAFLVPLIAIAIGAAASAAINVIVAAAQGASLTQIGKAAGIGAISGAVGTGLGIVFAGVNVGISSLAGTLPQNVTLSSAINALGEVAMRSAFSTTIANAASQTAGALGAPGEVTTIAGIAAGYAGSTVYDQFLLGDGGALSPSGHGGVEQASSKATHSNLTYQAARKAGFNDFESRFIVSNNIAEDGPSSGGLFGFMKGLISPAVLNNETHFGFGAQQTLARLEGALRSPATWSLKVAGQATHYLQDQYALGHIFPGTHLLAGTPGWFFRGLVHQTFGGEITFQHESFDATVGLLSARPS
jgi:RHS repeat-associated protein